jgi:hypothetical protein
MCDRALDELAVLKRQVSDLAAEVKAMGKRLRAAEVATGKPVVPPRRLPEFGPR